MARESDLQNGRQLSFRIHDGEEAFGNLFGATLAGRGAFRFADPLGDVVAGGVIQLVIPAPKRAGTAKNALEFRGDGYNPLVEVEFDLKMRNTAFRNSRSPLHA